MKSLAWLIIAARKPKWSDVINFFSPPIQILKWYWHKPRSIPRRMFFHISTRTKSQFSFHTNATNAADLDRLYIASDETNNFTWKYIKGYKRRGYTARRSENNVNSFSSKFYYVTRGYLYKFLYYFIITQTMLFHLKKHQGRIYF